MSLEDCFGGLVDAKDIKITIYTNGVNGGYIYYPHIKKLIKREDRKVVFAVDERILEWSGDYLIEYNVKAESDSYVNHSD